MLHVQLHAPLEARVRYLLTRVEEIPADTRPDEASLRELCRTFDARRAEYVRRMFGKDWLDPENYDLSIDTGSMGVEAAGRPHRAGGAPARPSGVPARPPAAMTGAAA